MIKKNKKWLCAAYVPLAFFMMSANVQARTMTEYPRVKLQSLDKATARTMTFEAKIGSTLKFGPLYMKVQSCQKSSPIDQPESAAFLQIWEVDTNTKAQWVFSGWMFSSSPGLSSMEHPIYDVWVIDCLDDNGVSGGTQEDMSADQPESEADVLVPAPDNEDDMLQDD